MAAPGLSGALGRCPLTKQGLLAAKCSVRVSQLRHGIHRPAAVPRRHRPAAKMPVVRAASACGALPPPTAQPYNGLQRLCKNLLIGTAAAAVWSLVASTIASGGPSFASLSLSVGGTQTPGAEVAAKSAWAGLAAGFLHTLCGPDHLAALTPLTIGRNRAAASALGALWGFGHSTGQLILGLVFILLKERFHDFLPALSKWSGTVVGLTLIAIGAMGIYETYFEGEGSHGDEEAVAKLAVAGAGGGSGAVDGGGSIMGTAAKAGLATYATGIVYGLQPDALFVVVPALALPTKLAAVAYCTMFVLGTVTAMGGYTAIIGTTSAALTRERPWLQAHLSTIASGVAIVVGLLILASGFGLGNGLSLG